MGKSLFERADDLFELGGGSGQFRPAQVPDRLDEPPNPRALRKVVRRAMIVEELHEQGADDTDADIDTVSAQPVPEPAAHRVMPDRAPDRAIAVRRVDFTGPVQPLDLARMKRQGLILPGAQTSALMEEFRIVKRHLLLAARDARESGAGADAQRILVCSPLPGDGKTFCAANLALAMAAERDTEVVLVDADFAKPSILSLLGLEKGPGLMDALANPAVAVEDCVIPTDVPGLFVLPAGEQTASDSEYLASERTRQVLDRLVQGATNRIVIFDSPPVLAASPAADLARLAGQALLICRADRTAQTALDDALSLLSACPDIKLLLNSTNFSPSGRRFGSYYGYGG